MESKGKRAAHLAAPMQHPPMQHQRSAATPAEAIPASPVAPVETPPAAPVAAPEPVMPRISSPPPKPVVAGTDITGAAGDAHQAIAESGAALARGWNELGDAFAAYTRHRIDATSRTAIDMLRVKTWYDAIALNTGFARTSFDQWLESSAKVSDLSIKLALESSRPLLPKFIRD